MSTCTIKFTIEDATINRTDVLLAIDSSGDEKLSPRETVPLSAAPAGGNSVLWTGNLELDENFPSGAFYKFSFKAPVGSKWRYEIRIDGTLVAKKEIATMTHKFDLTWGTFS